MKFNILQHLFSRRFLLFASCLSCCCFEIDLCMSRTVLICTPKRAFKKGRKKVVFNSGHTHTASKFQEFGNWFVTYWFVPLKRLVIRPSLEFLFRSSESRHQRRSLTACVSGSDYFTILWSIFLFLFLLLLHHFLLFPKIWTRNWLLLRGVNSWIKSRHKWWSLTSRRYFRSVAFLSFSCLSLLSFLVFDYRLLRKSVSTNVYQNLAHHWTLVRLNASICASIDTSVLNK